MLSTKPSTNPDVQSVVGDAQWLPVKPLANGTALQFTWVSREDRAKVSFLTEEYLQEVARPSVSLPMQAVRQNLPPLGAPPGYLFHSAFCRSTLLTRALDVAGVAHGLAEPQLVNELALLGRHGKLTQELLESGVRLLARPFEVGETAVVKPGNEANLLIPALLDLHPVARAVCLYAPLPRFLRSVAGKALWGRSWVRRLYSGLRKDHPLPFGFNEAELFQQTDLQIGALAWLTHLHQFQAARVRYGERVRCLDSEAFGANKAAALFACAGHLGLGGDQAFWQERAESPVFSGHSKLIGTAFDGVEAASRAESDAVTEEIDLIFRWAEAVAGHIGMSIQPDAAAMLLPAS